MSLRGGVQIDAPTAGAVQCDGSGTGGVVETSGRGKFHIVCHHMPRKLQACRRIGPEAGGAHIAKLQQVCGGQFGGGAGDGVHAARELIGSVVEADFPGRQPAAAAPQAERALLGDAAGACGGLQHTTDGWAVEQQRCTIEAGSVRDGGIGQRH